MTDSNRPACVITAGHDEAIAELADELRTAPRFDEYEASLLLFLARNLGIAPRAVFSRALQALYREVTGERATKKRLLGGKAPKVLR